MGNTQGIRFSRRPPSKAPSSAAANVSDGAGAAAALLRSAASSAGDTPVAAATAGHWPTTLASVRQPCAPEASTTGMTVGLWLRCGETGTRAVQVSPCQACVHLRRGFDHFTGFREKLQRLAAQRGRQARDTELERIALDPRRALAAQRLGLRIEGGLEGRRIQRGGAARRNLQRELAFFGDAFLLAHQPTGLELDLHVAAQQRRLEVRRDGERNRQQHRALVAVVGQRADGDLLGHRPGDVAGQHARRQGPLQLRGQAGIARVLPVGVPLGLVRQLQAHPDRLARREAIRGMRHEFGAHALGRHDALGAHLRAGHGRQQEGSHQNDGIQ